MEFIMKSFLPLLIIGLLIICLMANAQIPKKISYQGMLTTPNGTPVQDGSYSFQFKLYPTVSGGTPLWIETQVGVPVGRGVFNVFLGSVTPFNVSFSTPLFLEVITIGGPGISEPLTMLPRSEFTSSPYAMWADTASYAIVTVPTGNAGGDLTGTFPNPVIANSVVTSAKILDSTIQREDVQPTFKSPYADTADYARVLSDTGGRGWNFTGNAGTIAGTNFVGTTDNQAFDIRTNNILRTRITTRGQIETFNTGQSVFVGEGAGSNDYLTSNGNVFVGYQAGFSNVIGYNNTANGYQALYSNTSGILNTATGSWALYSNTTGERNTANGLEALRFNTIGEMNTATGAAALYHNTTGNNNTANGYWALFFNNAGYNNTANGYQALFSNTTGNGNTANGYQALYLNTTADYNTANGYQALYSNTIGIHNTANGYQALYSNTIGASNTATGAAALYHNTTGFGNTANGSGALAMNTTGYYNTANGSYALIKNTTGSSNVANGEGVLNQNTTGSGNAANGSNALQQNTSGNENTANGGSALYHNTTGNGNTANGCKALISNNTGDYNTALGYNANVSAGDLSNATVIGSGAIVGASNAMTFGNTSVTKWGFGTTPGAANILEFNNAVTTAVLTTGGVWTNASDRNLKENFSTIDGKLFLEKLSKLPVTIWNYKNEPKDIKHIGPIAQDFYAIFGLGNGDKTISTIDPAGVALAAAKELYQQNQELVKRVEQLELIIKSLTGKDNNNNKVLGEVR
jgi:hypothetical protein